MKSRLGAVAGIAVLGALSIALPGSAGGNKYADTTQQQPCKDGQGNTVGIVALNGPAKLWPPNHKFVDESGLATATDSSDEVALTVYPSKVESATGGDGGTNHDPDWTPGDLAATGTGSAEVPFQVRAERSGKGDGRTYVIDWVATFGETECDSGTSSTDDYKPFLITVPHDMRGGQDWKS